MGMDDSFISEFYTEMQKDSKNIKRFYNENAKIKYIKEINSEEIKYSLTNYKGVLDILGECIKTIDIHTIDKIKTDIFTTYHCIGIFVCSNFIYHRFSHQIIVNNKEEILAESIILLNEKIKFDENNSLIYKNEKNLNVDEIISNFEKFGKIKNIKKIENEEIKIYFSSQLEKDKALASLNPKL